MIGEPISIILLLLLIVGLGLRMEQSQRFGQYGVVVIIFGAAFCRQLGLFPASSAVYSFVLEYFVPVALPMLLFKANLRKIWNESGRVLLAFLLAVAATLAGCFVAVSLVPFEPDFGVWAAIMTSGFIGGSANTASVADAMGKLNDPTMGVIIAASYSVAIPFLLLLLSLPSIKVAWGFINKFGETTEKITDPVLVVGANRGAENTLPAAGSLSILNSFLVSIAIFAISLWLAEFFSYPPVKYIAITCLSVIVASLMSRSVDQHLAGHFEIGRLLMYVFFAILGVLLDITKALESGWQIITFVLILTSVHLVVIVLMGRFFKLSGAEILIASNACIFGPPTAAAMAAARGWHDLVTPGVLVGVLGYSIANILGIGLATIL